jgi:perosamine synthetase
MTAIPAPPAPTPLKVGPAPAHFPAEDRASILQEIDKVLSSGRLTLGRLGRDLEERFAARHGAKHAVAVNSGTSAVEIPLRRLGVAGMEVLVPANASVATAAAVIAAGARPRLVDCDPETLGIDVVSARAAIGPRTAGVVVEHIGGAITPRMTDVLTMCLYHGLFMVEDAGAAHGSSINGRSVGTFGMAGSFSFASTNVVTWGEGGMIVTDSDRIAAEARLFRDQGRVGSVDPVHVRLGHNWRMSEPHAAIALSQLARLDEFVAHRQRVAARYDRGLAGLPVWPRPVPPTASCNYQKYIVFLPEGVDRPTLEQMLHDDYGVVLDSEV